MTSVYYDERVEFRRILYLFMLVVVCIITCLCVHYENLCFTLRIC